MIDNLAITARIPAASRAACTAMPHRPAITHRRRAPSAGSQWAQALAYLHAHPKRVSPITIELGGNDVLLSLGSANLSATRKRLNRIFNSLRAAAPRSDIIVFDLYNPLGIPLAPLTTLNSILRHEASAHRAIFCRPRPDLCRTHGTGTSIRNDVHPTDLVNALWQPRSGRRIAPIYNPDPDES